MNKSFSPLSKTLAIGWLLLAMLAFAFLMWLLPQSKINSSVLAMLPKQSMGEISPELNQAFLQRLDKQILWLVGTGAKSDPQLAALWQAKLQTIPAIAQVRGAMSPEQQQAWMTFFWQHRNALIDPQTRARLAQQGAEQIQWVTAQIYSAFAGVGGAELSQDPLLLTRSIQLALANNSSKLRLQDGWLVAQDEQGDYWYLLHGELQGNSFDIRQTHALVSSLEDLKQDFLNSYPQAKILSRGTVFYSDFASQQAKKDISTLGSATVLGVILLIYWVFRSLRPLLLVSLSVALGALFGTLVTLLVFDELHLMTLAMSMSVIGISVDYAIYYLTERMVHGHQRTPEQSVLLVRKALLLALLTTVLGYCAIMFAPFPGIRQMAVFASAGLSAACLTVILWFPKLAAVLPVRPLPLKKLLVGWLILWRDRPSFRFGVPLGLAVIAALGISQIEVNDDIALLQAAPKHLQQQERVISALTGQNMEQKWFIVSAATAQQTLETIENFAPALAQAQQQGWLDHYTLLPLNSLARQQADLELLDQTKQNVQTMLSELGVEQASLDTSAMPVTVKDWLTSPASEGLRLMWVSLPSGQSGALIPVSGIHNSAALNQLASNYPGVTWVDRKLSFDTLFATYRNFLSYLLLAALAIVALGAVLRLGFWHGLQSTVPSVLSLATGLSVLGFLGLTLNLFSMLALVLVLGIGINYTLFFSNRQATALTSLLAVSLAMLTTTLTLGMLAFSSTQAIQNFGLILIVGIFVAFLLSPLALAKDFEISNNV